MEAIANGTNLAISRKESIEICRLLRNKSTERAKKIHENVIEKKEAVPYRVYNGSVPHRKGKVGPGRYPMKASGRILSLIKSAEANAENKGMGKSLIISHISVHKGETQSRYGRKMGKKAKRTHVKIIVVEKK